MHGRIHTIISIALYSLLSNENKIKEGIKKRKERNLLLKKEMGKKRKYSQLPKGKKIERVKVDLRNLNRKSSRNEEVWTYCQSRLMFFFRIFSLFVFFPFIFVFLFLCKFMARCKIKGLLKSWEMG